METKGKRGPIYIKSDKSSSLTTSAKFSLMTYRQNDMWIGMT